MFVLKKVSKCAMLAIYMNSRKKYVGTFAKKNWTYERRRKEEYHFGSGTGEIRT